MTDAKTKINQIFPEGTEISDNDRFIADHDTGGAVFDTQQFKWQTMRAKVASDLIRLESTGVFTGGDIVKQSTTEYNILPGTGQIVDALTGTITQVAWSQFSNITPAYLTIADEQYTYVYIYLVGDTPTVGEQNTPFDADDSRTKITIGYILHTVVDDAFPPSAKIITDVSNAYRKILNQTVEYGVDSVFDMSVEITKPFKLDYGTGSDLKIGLTVIDDTIGGQAKIVGGGTTGVPNYIDITSINFFNTIYLGYIKSTGEPIIVYHESGLLGPDAYNPIGSNLIDVEEDFWSIQRLYYYPQDNIPLVLYGRAQYESLNTAFLNIGIENTEDLNIFSKFLKPTVFMGYLIVKQGTTDLSDGSKAVFIPALEPTGARYIDNVNCGIAKGGVVSDVGGTDIEWTGGQIYAICLGITEDFVDGGTTLSGDGIHYIYWQQGSGILTSTTKPALPKVLIARAGVQNGDIVELFQENVLTTDFTQIKEALDRNFGLSVTEGMFVEPDTDVTYALDMKMSQGSYDINMRTQHDTSAVETRTTPFVRYYHSGGTWTNDTNNEIDTVNYDNGTNRVAIPANKWCVGIVTYQHDEQNDISKITWLYPIVLHDNQTAAVLYANEIRTGLIDIPNQPHGLVSSPTLMAYVFRQNDTTLAAPSTSPTRWVDLRPRVGNFIGGGGGEIVAVDGEQIYFVAKHGNDSNNGKSWEEAFATIPAATAAVLAQTPSSTNIFSIVGYDAGIYSESINLPAWTKLYMPNATLAGNSAIIANSWLHFRELRQCQITTTATSGRAYIDAQILEVAAFQVGLDITDGDCSVNAKFGRVDVNGNGLGIRFNKSTTFTNLSISQLVLRDANSIGIEGQSGELNVYCDNIFNAAGATGTIGVLSGGTCKLHVFLTGRNTADTPWSEVGSGLIYYISAGEGIKMAHNINVGDILANQIVANTSVGSPLVLTDKIDKAGGTVVIRDLGEQVSISGLNHPIADGTIGQSIITDGSATLSFASVGISGKIVQEANSTYTTVATGTTILPSDDTITQNTEGDEYMSVGFTPTSTSNYMLVIAGGTFSHSVATQSMTMALFRVDGVIAEANARAAVVHVFFSSTEAISPYIIIYKMDVLNLTAETFKIRAGSDQAGTTTFMGRGGSRLYGGTMNCFMRLLEIAP